jgi:hypothetical protein
MNKSIFYLHLKECELRFNHKGKNLYTLLPKNISKNPRCSSHDPSNKYEKKIIC